MTANGVYVYAIIHADRALPDGVGGVGGPAVTVRTVRQGEIAAVVSEAPAQLRARRRDLLAHQDLLLRLTDGGPVLPMRFGMVAPDEETVTAQLGRAESAHLATLEQLAGRVEVNLKAFPAQDALAALVAEDRNVRRLREEVRRRPDYDASVRLGEAVAAALSRRAAEAGRKALRTLTPLARSVRPGPEVQGCAVNVSFLVDRSDSDSFRATALGLADEYRDHAELRLAGPLPCYSFVGAETGPVTAAGV
ncbi:GvpL/GvpF family gas vesicle protein [Streptomyces sp. NPDC048560]|uniref:GvpL/GvpF family gas vesicle protein n=1 Tax=Streptomyces sp. NPDC048560 TaxID=3155488 RepID=UPI003441F4C4